MPDSEFVSVLQSEGWEVRGQSFVLLSPIPFTEVPECDWLFFSSQNAVRFFFQNLERQKLPLPDVRWAAMAVATARHIESFTGKVDFIGTGEPKGSAQLFRRLAAKMEKPPKVVFPAATRTRQGAMTLLQADFDCSTFDIYDNQPVEVPPVREEDVLAFTSPMNVEAYFSKNKLLPKQRVVAIGGATDRALQQFGIRETAIAAEASERGLAEAVLAMSK
jgi:uroporphyrinogen-III synthase